MPSHSLIDHFYPQNSAFSYEVLRAAGYANYGGADLGEIINICSRIPAGDEEAWLEQWSAAAQRAEQHALASAAAKNSTSAFEGCLKAANYYRTGEFYLRDPTRVDSRAAVLANKAIECFNRGMEYSPYEVEQVEIGYEARKQLPALFFTPPLPPSDQLNATSTTTPRPTIIFNGGYDSTKEEAWFALAAAAVQRGFNVLSFDGPGQGVALRDRGMHFRPDWEVVIRHVVDYVLTRRDVDERKIVLFGWSMGGYLAARAAAFEHRLAALILDDGVYDFGAAFRQTLPFGFMWLIENRYDGVTAPIIDTVKRMSTGMKWGVNNGMWTFGASTAPEFLRMVQEYCLEGVCGKIEAKTLVLDAERDHFLKGQPRLLYDRLLCEKRFVSLTEADGGETHCHQGAFQRLHQVVFDFLCSEVV